MAYLERSNTANECLPKQPQVPVKSSVRRDPSHLAGRHPRHWPAERSTSGWSCVL